MTQRSRTPPWSQPRSMPPMPATIRRSAWSPGKRMAIALEPEPEPIVAEVEPVVAAEVVPEPEPERVVAAEVVPAPDPSLWWRPRSSRSRSVRSAKPSCPCRSRCSRRRPTLTAWPPRRTTCRLPPARRSWTCWGSAIRSGHGRGPFERPAVPFERGIGIRQGDGHTNGVRAAGPRRVLGGIGARGCRRHDPCRRPGVRRMRPVAQRIGPVCLPLRHPAGPFGVATGRKA